MTTWADHRDRETARLATELAATQDKLNTVIAEAPWYGRWLLRALWLACRVWVLVRR